jgi:hypothetical protein
MPENETKQKGDETMNNQLPLEVGKIVTLYDDSKVTVMKVESENIFLAREENGKAGIFFAYQLKQSAPLTHDELANGWTDYSNANS